MKETKNNKGIKETKEFSTKTTKVEKKVDEKKVELNTLFNKTANEISTLAAGIVACPTKAYTGFKVGGKIISSLRPKKEMFIMSLHIYDEKGHLETVELFDIKTGGKEASAVIQKILIQILESYKNITAANKAKEKKAKAKNAEPAKEVKKEEKKDEKNSN